jgi:DNA-binding response OmpR family regulator
MTGKNGLAEKSQQVKTILIVEDDEDIGVFLELAITTETGYHCLLAADGFHAMEHVKTVVPDLFLLDYQLPNMNGLELYDYLHGQEALQHVPALFMSVNPPMKELEKRRVYAIKKPFELEEMLQPVRAMLEEPASE